MAIAAALGLAAACAGAPRYAARGAFHGLRYDSAADAESARCLVAGDCAPALRARIEAAAAGLAPGTPDREGLRRIAEEFSLDTATLVFVERVLADPENRRLQDAYLRELAAVKAGEPLLEAPRPPALCAPGWFYKTNPENGGDFRAVRERFEALGVPAPLIAFDENGAIEANAAAVADAVRRGPEEGYVLISASKSGPEAAYALGALLGPEEARKVRAWVNVVGVIGGSPLADHALAPPKSWLVAFDAWKNDFDLAGLRGMTTEASLGRLARMRFPPDLLILNYLGAPLSGDISDRGREGYEELAPYGPNDGLVVLADALAPGGATILESGVDHYVATPDVADRALALYRVVTAEAARREAAL